MTDEADEIAKQIVFGNWRGLDREELAAALRAYGASQRNAGLEEVAVKALEQGFDWSAELARSLKSTVEPHRNIREQTSGWNRSSALKSTPESKP